MSQFIAMLRDSFREAIDGWIFLVMLVLSSLLILLVGSMSFRPLSAEEALPRIVPFSAMQSISADRGRSNKVREFPYLFTIPVDSRVITEGKDPWESDGRIVLTFVSTQTDNSTQKTLEELKEEFTKDEKSEKTRRDPIQDVARFWASKGEMNSNDWPAYSDSLAEDFVAFQVQFVTGVNVKKVEKIGYGQYAVTTGSSPRVAWPHKPSLFFGAVPISFLQLPLGKLIYLVEDSLVNWLGAWVALLAGVVVTAGFIPNMLRKGAIDLLLTKPISRPLILVYKYLGGLVFMFLLTVFTSGGIWFVVGLRTGVWAPGLLLASLSITFYFAILYACSTLFGVLTRNAIVSIVTTMFFWCVVFVIGFAHNKVVQFDKRQIQLAPLTEKANSDEKLGEAAPNNDTGSQSPKDLEVKLPSWLVQTTRILNRIVPRTNDLDTLTSQLLAQQMLPPADRAKYERASADVDWPEVIIVSLVYIAGFLGLAMLRFVTRSY